MKKQIVIGLALLTAVALSSCESPKDNIKENTKTEESTNKKEPDKNKTETEEQKTEENPGQQPESGDSDGKTESVKVNVYYPDPESGELVPKTVEMESVDAQMIWKELRKAGVVSEETAVLGVEVDEGSQTMILDLNAAFGEQLRSMGTTGEKEIIDSIVATYLEAFKCQKLKITEESGVLASGHKEYGEYLEKK